MKQRYVFVLADESGNVKEPAANIAAKVQTAQTSVSKPATMKKAAPLLKEPSQTKEASESPIAGILEGVADIGLDKVASVGLGAVGTLLGPVGAAVGTFVGSQTSNIIKLLD